MIPSFKFSFNSIQSVLLIIVSIFICYSNVFNASFQFDDFYFIVKNEELKSFDFYKVLHNWTDLHKRTFSRLTFTLNYKIHGLQTWGYHLFNVIIHCVSSIFLFFFLKEIFDGRVKGSVILIGTLIYACHPLNTQAVSYIVQRMASLSGMFYIGALLFYLKSRKQMLVAVNVRSIVLLLVAFLFFLLSISSKQNGITIPIAFLALELLFIFSESKRKSLLFMTPFFVLILLFLFFFIGNYPEQISLISQKNSSYFATQQEVLFHYLRLFVLPVGQNVDHLYSHSEGFGWLQFILLLCHLLLIGVAFFVFKRNRVLAFAIFFFYIAHIVESSVLYIHDPMVEHRMYIPMIGVVIVFTYVVDRMRTVRFFMVGVALLLAFPIRTFVRNSDYKTQITLWESSVAQNPANSRALYNLAQAYYMEGNLDAALLANKKSLEINPTENSLFLKTVLDIHRAKYKSAERGIKELERIDAPKYRAMFLRAFYYQSTKDFTKSLKFYNQLDFSDYWPAVLHYSLLMIENNKSEEALFRVENELTRASDNSYTHLSKAYILRDLGRCAEIDVAKIVKESFSKRLIDKAKGVYDNCL